MPAGPLRPGLGDAVHLAIGRQRRPTGRARALPNNAMQLTKLRAAPGRAYKVPPCAPAGQTGGGTASQLIASVRRTKCGSVEEDQG